MAGREDREAYVTLATNDTYALGCLVLGSSLRRVGTTRKLAVMVTPGVSQSIRDQLSRVFDLVYDVDLLDSRDPTNLQLLGRPDLNVTFTKFHCWRLTMFDKAVFLDADTLVLQNVDELFNREELSAAPDAGWPDCFNSGVFVFKPSEETYNAILQFALDVGSFDGGDQGLLNMFFRGWATEDISRHLPFIYNVVSQAFYSYLPAFKQFKDTVKIVHFIGATKPWHQPFNTSTGEVNPLPGCGHNQDFLQRWWMIFMEDVQPFMDPSLMSMLSTTTPQKKVETHQPKPNLQSVFPFVPPVLESVFYEEKPDSSKESDLVTKPPLMDVERGYTELEGHYVEEPMTSLNTQSPSSVIYDAPKVVQTWTSGNDPSSYQKEQTNNNHSNSSQNDQCDSHENKYTVEPENKSSEEQNSVNNEEYKQSEIVNNHNYSDENISLTENKENEGGLLGELAVLRISKGSDPEYQLSSRERKLNWEKGQVDYLGADAFENIQKKLDAALTGPPEPPKPTTSPFSRPANNDTPTTPSTVEKLEKPCD